MRRPLSLSLLLLMLGSRGGAAPRLDHPRITPREGGGAILEAGLALPGGEIRLRASSPFLRELPAAALRSPLEEGGVPGLGNGPQEVRRRRRPSSRPGGLRTPEPSEGPLAPWPLELPGCREAVLREAPDPRMVQQRALPPRLSRPFHLEVLVGSVRWSFGYDSRGESYGIGPVEDRVSTPVLDAWRARDPDAFRATAFARAVAEVVAATFDSASPPLARAPALQADLRIRGTDGGPGLALAPRGPRLLTLPGPPEPLSLGFEVRREETQVYADQLLRVVDIPAREAAVHLLSSIGRLSLARGRTDPRGALVLSLTPRGPERIRLEIESRSPEVPRLRQALVWRWGRPAEGWLDTGVPRFPGLPPELPPGERLGALVASLLHAYSPDDDTFHGGGGSTGWDGLLVRHALVPALEALGGPPVPPPGTDPRALARLREAVGQELAGSAPYFGTGWLRDPSLSPRSQIPAQDLIGPLEALGEDVSELGEDHWDLGQAAAACKLALLEANGDLPLATRTRIQAHHRHLQGALRAHPLPSRAGVASKAGPQAPTPDREGSGMALLLMGHAWKVSGTPGWEGLLERAREELGRRPPGPRYLGAAAQVLGDLVRVRGVSSLGPLHQELLERVWGLARDPGPEHSLEDRLRLIQAYLPL